MITLATKHKFILTAAGAVFTAVLPHPPMAYAQVQAPAAMAATCGAASAISLGALALAGRLVRRCKKIENVLPRRHAGRGLLCFVLFCHWP